MNRPTPPTYKIRNWRAYNEALKRRGSPGLVNDLVRSRDDLGGQTDWQARQPTYSDAAIQTCLTTARQGIAQQCPERG